MNRKPLVVKHDDDNGRKACSEDCAFYVRQGSELWDDDAYVTCALDLDDGSCDRLRPHADCKPGVYDLVKKETEGSKE